MRSLGVVHSVVIESSPLVPQSSNNNDVHYYVRQGTMNEAEERFYEIAALITGYSSLMAATAGRVGAITGVSTTPTARCSATALITTLR